jgi:hypothetical protein
MQQQTAQRHTEINDKVAEMTADAERSAMIAEHTVLRECERRRAALLREQMDVKQTILKHQLKVCYNGSFDLLFSSSQPRPSHSHPTP